MNYAKFEFLSISGMIFSPTPDHHRGSAQGCQSLALALALALLVLALAPPAKKSRGLFGHYKSTTAGQQTSSNIANPQQQLLGPPRQEQQVGFWSRCVATE